MDQYVSTISTTNASTSPIHHIALLSIHTVSIATFGRRTLSSNPHTKSSINYSREDLDTRMAIGTIDIVGRMRSRVDTSEDTNDRHSLLLHEIEQ